MSRIMHDGFAIALAWPETWCKQAGAWYDYSLYMLGINRQGYYRVGHAAVILIDDESGVCRYFDFGRYHAPYRHGRVRSGETDHDLLISTKAVIDPAEMGIQNLNEILKELYHNPSTHGDGTIYGSVTRINFSRAMSKARSLQDQEFIPYGPFVRPGTNCSRFVNCVIRAGEPSISERWMLDFPLTISPSPMWNLRALKGPVLSYREEDKAIYDNYSCIPLIYDTIT